MNLTKKFASRNNKYKIINKILCRHPKTFPQNRPDLVEIIVLTELVGLKRRFADQDADFYLKNCFAYFWKRFRISKLQMQKVSNRLHSSGIVTRSFREVITEDRVYKELDLKLNIDCVNVVVEAEVQ